MTSERTPMPCSSGQTEFTSLEQSRLKRRHRWFSSQRHKTTTTRELFIWGCSLITQKISGQSLLLGTFAAFYVISQSPSKKKKTSMAILSTPTPPFPHTPIQHFPSSHSQGRRASSEARCDEERPYHANTRANTGVFTARCLRKQCTARLLPFKTRPIPSSPLSWQFAALCLHFLWSLGIKEQPLWAVSD